MVRKLRELRNSLVFNSRIESFENSSIFFLSPYCCHIVPKLQFCFPRLQWKIGITFCDEGLVPDLPSGRGRSVGGDLDIGEEGSKQTIVTLQSLHYCSIG
jgi:hypothetical protein